MPFKISARRKLLLYQSLVLSILLYGCSVWQPSMTHMRKLHKFQSRVFRWIISDLDYVSKLHRISFLPVYYQKIESDMFLLWKKINKQAEVENELQSSFFNTRSSTLGLFSVHKTQKFCSEDIFFVRATRCANELLKLNLIKLNMPQGIFRAKIHIFLVEKLTYLNIDISCYYFVKCFCKKLSLLISPDAWTK